MRRRLPLVASLVVSRRISRPSDAAIAIMSSKDKIDDAVERLRSHVNKDVKLVMQPTPGAERKRVMLAGTVIRQLPLPPRRSALETQHSQTTMRAARPLIAVRTPEFWRQQSAASPPLPQPPTSPATGKAASPSRRPPSPRALAIGAEVGAAAAASSFAPPIAPPAAAAIAPNEPDQFMDFLPLDMFNPEEALGLAAVGMDARSQYLGLDGQSRWEPCKVVGFDEVEALYEIRWRDAPGGKSVSRFNLRLEGEESGGTHAQRWENNKREATERLKEAELALARHLREGYHASRSLSAPSAGADRFVLSRERLLEATARFRSGGDHSSFDQTYDEARDLFGKVQAELQAIARRAQTVEPSRSIATGGGDGNSENVDSSTSRVANVPSLLTDKLPDGTSRTSKAAPALVGTFALDPASQATAVDATDGYDVGRPGYHCEVDTQEVLAWLRVHRDEELRGLQQQRCVRKVLHAFARRAPLASDPNLLRALQRVHNLCEKGASSTPLVARMPEHGTLPVQLDEFVRWQGKVLDDAREQLGEGWLEHTSQTLARLLEEEFRVTQETNDRMQRAYESELKQERAQTELEAKAQAAERKAMALALAVADGRSKDEVLAELEREARAVPLAMTREDEARLLELRLEAVTPAAQSSSRPQLSFISAEEADADLSSMMLRSQRSPAATPQPPSTPRLPLSPQALSPQMQLPSTSPPPLSVHLPPLAEGVLATPQPPSTPRLPLSPQALSPQAQAPPTPPPPLLTHLPPVAQRPPFIVAPPKTPPSLDPDVDVSLRMLSLLQQRMQSAVVDACTTAFDALCSDIVEVPTPRWPAPDILGQALVRGHAPLALPLHLISTEGGGLCVACRVTPEEYAKAVRAHIDSIRKLAAGLERIDLQLLGKEATPMSFIGPLGLPVSLDDAIEQTWRVLDGCFEAAAEGVRATLARMNDTSLIKELSRPRDVSLEDASSSQMLAAVCMQVETGRLRANEADGLFDDEIVVGPFCLDCAQLKQDLRAAQEEHVAKLLNELKRQVLLRSGHLGKTFDQLSKSLTKMPESPDELYELKQKVVSATTSVLDMQPELNAVGKLFEDLERLRCFLDDSEARRRWEASVLDSES